MHLRSKLTYLLVTLYINNKTVSLWERAKHPYTGEVASEQQTTRTAPEDFDGYSAAPAGQRVVDVKTSAVRGVGLKAGIAEDLHADNLRTRSGLPRQVLTGSMRRVGHRVGWPGARQEAHTQALRRVVGPLPGPHGGRTGMLRREHDPPPGRSRPG
ncbi:MAG: hypothetical protein QOE48_2505 [Mycobacterium sp.]|jgi:hypothetical protein|nr:hypothetical protein [Mycobacterium sp.]